MTALEKQGALARAAEAILATVSTEKKNEALLAIADAITAREAEWLAANAEDVRVAEENGMNTSLLDRLTLNHERVAGVAEGIRSVAALPDPIGTVLSTVTRPNGLVIQKKRVPLGVIGIIYEARPNVTADAAVLCLKSGNACILRGGKEAFRANCCVTAIMRDALKSVGLPEDCIALVQDTSRESATELMNLTEYLDVLIPRGGAGLIRSVVKNARVPIIRTGEGVCHVYIDKDADLEMGAKILFNAKCSRPSVCNAAECAVIHRDVLRPFLQLAVPLLNEKSVQLRADETSHAALGDRAIPATDADWDTEYGNYVLAVRTVESLDEAIDFINSHSTKHSEAIVTRDAEAAERFLNEVDAAAVYWNASTRYTDGGEFGLGAEIGISTQKLHARGPMGLEELTSSKYIVRGNGQVR
ncbi:MAG: glutamate-5-semialdehyde dehydrogenase [Oscillospiraceae bacterium]|nr:glutamate-5-semialdehyde dehydrogenase [Oscillospiraceae bacterium]